MEVPASFHKVAYGPQREVDGQQQIDSSDVLNQSNLMQNESESPEFLML